MKRSAEESSSGADAENGFESKRQKALTLSSNALASVSSRLKEIIKAAPKRTSGLKAPTMLLAGHSGEVFCVKFSPSGETVASASSDQQIYMWRVYGNCDNYCAMSGHKKAILDLHYSTDGSKLYSASADKTAAIWDVEYGEKIKTLKGMRGIMGHEAIVECCRPARRGPELIVTGGDDDTIRLWDTRMKKCVHTFFSGFPVLSVSFSDSADSILSGGIDSKIKVWDIRRKELDYEIDGHEDAVTGVSLSPDGSYLLSNSMDNSVRIFDVRPFATGNRCVKVFYGVQHGVDRNLLRCSWSPDGSMVAAGSSDSPSHVYVWDTASRKILYKLPGHGGAVNDVDFHPSEPMIVSAGSDGKIFLGELEEEG